MTHTSLPQKLHYTLRITSAMCFIGHGSFGIITKPIWCNYFGFFGIDKAMSYQLMPIVGVFDIVLGIMVLVYPIRAILAWLVVWGIVTAMLRPLTGEPFAEFIERAGNYGAPLVLLLISETVNGKKGWFSAISPSKELNEETLNRVMGCLRIIVFLLLLGHGWLNLIEKKGLLDQYASVGIADTTATAHIIGVFEILGALMVLVKPIRQLVFILFIWKMLSEMLYPHYVVFEWVERGGSYGALLALWMITERKAAVKLSSADIFKYSGKSPGGSLGTFLLFFKRTFY